MTCDVSWFTRFFARRVHSVQVSALRKLIKMSSDSESSESLSAVESIEEKVDSDEEILIESEVLLSRRIARKQ